MNKKRKYAYAAMTSSALAIAVIIVINIIAAVASDKFSLSLDLTKDKVLDLSDTTKQVISELDMDVNIISLIPTADTNREMIQIDELLKKYDAMSDHISYKRADAQKNPGLLTKYETNGYPLDTSYYIIFETERMYSVVSVNDIVIFYKDTIGGKYVSGALEAEKFFTSALLKVTKGSDTHVYIANGHGERFSAKEFDDKILPASGYNFHDYSIMSEPIPDDADAIIIVAPQTDYSADEIEKINSYLMQGGSVQVFADPYTNNITNLSLLLQEWGIELHDGLVADDNSAHYVKYRYSVIAEIGENEMTGTFSHGNSQVVFPISRPVSAQNKNDITAYTVASTSDDGYVKSNISPTFDTFESGDTRQKSDIAVMTTRPNYEGSQPKLFVSGSVAFLEAMSNKRFYQSLTDSMTNQPYSVYIQPKNILQSRVTMSQAMVYVYIFITVILIPIVILGCGFIIWIKRRHL